MRICVVGALTVGIVLTVVASASYAAHVSGQVGYGAPQVLGEQFIKPKNASSSSWGLWLGVIIALLILGGTGLFGWRRVHAEQA
ncbi:MAG: hypothetical protein JO265_11580 [Acidimicrobiia bacterium]|nr:hypothetical protein [Acidimicrobiia bacterium]